MASVAMDSIVREHARRVNAAMARYLPPADAALATSLREYLALDGDARPGFAVYEPMRHVLEAGGKRIRPALCLLAHASCGGRPEDALPTAAGLEFLHTFTLVHDDIMDKASERRARPTVGALWGDDVAITVGDALFALAFEAFTDNARVPGLPHERVLEVLRMASRVCIQLAQGQTLDLLYAKRRDVTVREYEEMIRLKTGVLLELSLASGAILAGCDAAGVRALARVGAPLGAAFQVRDDLLDLVGDGARLGKPVGHDIRTGKRTLMVAHAFERSPRAARLAAILDAPPAATTDAMVREAIDILREAGSLDHARAEAERQLALAKRALAELPRSFRDVAALEGLADYVVRREE